MRRRLQGVTHDLLGWLVSRQNDAEGWWALGRLYAEGRTFRFAPLARTVEPESPTALLLLPRIRTVLERSLHAHGVRPDALRAAEVTIAFDTPHEAVRRTRGEPFVARVALTVAGDRVFAKMHFGHCARHDAEREVRRREGHRDRYSPMSSFQSSE